MNKENVDFLKERLFFLGFGENLNAELEKKIKSQNEKFTLSMPAEFGKGDRLNVVDYVLDFSKSKQQDMYFLNNYTATLRNDNLEKERTQKFYLNNGSGVTAKEAFNLLEGRPVYKNKLTNKDGQKYEAWLQLDLSQKDDKGNHKVQQFHKNWNYNLDKSLNKHPIKELKNDTQKDNLIASLLKGNIQQVTFLKDDSEVKMFVEANPKERNINMYDENMKKQFQGVRQHKSETEGQAQTTQENVESKNQTASQDVGGRGANSNGKDQHTETDKNNSQAVSDDIKQSTLQDKKMGGKEKSEGKTQKNDQPTKTRKKRGMSV